MKKIALKNCKTYATDKIVCDTWKKKQTKLLYEIVLKWFDAHDDWVFIRKIQKKKYLQMVRL